MYEQKHTHIYIYIYRERERECKLYWIVFHVWQSRLYGALSCSGWLNIRPQMESSPRTVSIVQFPNVIDLKMKARLISSSLQCQLKWASDGHYTQQHFEYQKIGKATQNHQPYWLLNSVDILLLFFACIFYGFCIFVFLHYFCQHLLLIY